METQIATTTALLKASAFLVFILVRAAMDIFSHGVHIYIPVYHWDENSLWLPSPKVVVFSQNEASMLICGENVHSCCVQRRAQTHVKRFHTFACDAVGLQCWVNVVVIVPLPISKKTIVFPVMSEKTYTNRSLNIGKLSLFVDQPPPLSDKLAESLVWLAMYHYLKFRKKCSVNTCF